MRRELSDEAAQIQADSLRDYLGRGGRGLALWLESKDFCPADRKAVLRAFHRERARRD